MPFNNSFFIEKLPILASIGVFPDELGIKQEILLDIKIKSDTLPLGCFSDQLSDTYCYQTLIEEVIAFIATKHFNLIEHLAYEILTVLENKFPKSSISIKVTKFPIINNQKQIISFTVKS